MQKATYQLGRSMIEMLGVLAIIAVLSVGGIAGYSKAMMKQKSNKLVNDFHHLIYQWKELKLKDKDFYFPDTDTLNALGLYLETENYLISPGASGIFTEFDFYLRNSGLCVPFMENGLIPIQNEIDYIYFYMDNGDEIDMTNAELKQNNLSRITELCKRFDNKLNEGGDNYIMIQFNF